ncbi:hypothetical protein AGR1A_Lc80296 [Agrobacterium fabacearum CFBP 5771]|nr:hypothetical protein AGR1A_Lc80296 [Agrobacterium fabacearum CFBP 5771]
MFKCNIKRPHNAPIEEQSTNTCLQSVAQAIRAYMNGGSLCTWPPHIRSTGSAHDRTAYKTLLLVNNFE